MTSSPAKSPVRRERTQNFGSARSVCRSVIHPWTRNARVRHRYARPSSACPNAASRGTTSTRHGKGVGNGRPLARGAKTCAGCDAETARPRRRGKGANSSGRPWVETLLRRRARALRTHADARASFGPARRVRSCVGPGAVQRTYDGSGCRLDRSSRLGAAWHALSIPRCTGVIGAKCGLSPEGCPGDYVRTAARRGMLEPSRADTLARTQAANQLAPLMRAFESAIVRWWHPHPHVPKRCDREDADHRALRPQTHARRKSSTRVLHRVSRHSHGIHT